MKPRTSDFTIGLEPGRDAQRRIRVTSVTRPELTQTSAGFAIANPFTR